MSNVIGLTLLVDMFLPVLHTWVGHRYYTARSVVLVAKSVNKNKWLGLPNRTGITKKAKNVKKVDKYQIFDRKRNFRLLSIDRATALPGIEITVSDWGYRQKMMKPKPNQSCNLRKWVMIRSFGSIMQ